MITEEIIRELIDAAAYEVRSFVSNSDDDYGTAPFDVLLCEYNVHLSGEVSYSVKSEPDTYDAPGWCEVRYDDVEVSEFAQYDEVSGDWVAIDAPKTLENKIRRAII